MKHYNPSSSQSNRDNFVQRLEHEVFKDAQLLSKMLQGMLEFEKKYNKEREGRDKKPVCFMCQKEGHGIHSCFKLFPHLKEKDEASRKKEVDSKRVNSQTRRRPRH